MTDQLSEADSGASFDERRVRVSRAAEVLAAAQHQSEQILHDAERFAADLLNTDADAAPPPDQLTEALGELVAHLRRFLVAWQDERTELREELRTIRSLLARDSDAEPEPAPEHGAGGAGVKRWTWTRSA